MTIGQMSLSGVEELSEAFHRSTQQTRVIQAAMAEGALTANNKSTKRRTKFELVHLQILKLGCANFKLGIKAVFRTDTCTLKLTRLPSLMICS